MIRKREGKKGPRWSVEVWDPATKKRRTVGTYGSEGEAKRVEAKHTLAAPARSAETCDGFAKRWLRDYPRPKRSTNETNRHALKPFGEDFKGVRLSDVDRQTAREWALKHRSNVSAVRALFGDAMRDGLVDANPFADLRLERSRGRRDVRVLTPADLDLLTEKATAEHGPEYGPTFGAMIVFSAYVGLRLGECLALRWADIDRKAREVTIERSLSKHNEITTPKAGKGRVVLLPDEASDMLGQVRIGHELVFTSKRGRAFTHGSHHATWRTVRSAAGMPDLDWHELRHFAGHHYYVRLGLGSELAAYQLGHSSPAMIEGLYGHGDQGALERLKVATENRVADLTVARGGKRSASSA